MRIEYGVLLDGYWNIDKNVPFISPTNVHTIGARAFERAYDLKKVILLNKVRFIDTRAFSECKNLYSVCGEEVQRIGDGAFLGCEKLVETNFKHVKNIEHFAFANCKALQSLYFPIVERIGAYAFIGCESLQVMHLPETLRSISSHAFMCCKNLRKIYIPTNAIVEENAFEECPKGIEVVRYRPQREANRKMNDSEHS